VGVSRTTGIIGIGAVKLTNSNNQCILPALTNLTQSLSFSLEIALSIASLGVDAGMLFSQADPNNPLLVKFKSSWTTLVFGMNEGSGGYNEATCSVDPTSFASTSHHVVVTYDSVLLSKNVYIDGDLCISVPTSQGPWNPPSSSYPFTIGCLATGTVSCSGGLSFGNSFGGVLDEVSIYGFSLSPVQVQAHYASFHKNFNYYYSLPSQSPPGTVIIGAFILLPVVVGLVCFVSRRTESSH